MLLQNMTPEEKLRQVSRLELDVRNSGRSWVEQTPDFTNGQRIAGII